MNSWLTIVFGLAAALAWGAGDFTGGIVSRRSRAVYATLIVEALGLVFPLAAGLLFREANISARDWLWCAIAGGVGSLGLLALYSALASGQVSLAAPVSAVSAASFPILLGFFLDGRPTPLTLLGLGLAIVSILLISTAQPGAPWKGLNGRTLGLPLLSGLGLGVYFVFMHQGSQGGVFWPMVSSRLAGTVVLLAYALSTRKFDFPVRALWPLALLNALFDVAGNVFYILAGQTGRMDVAVALGSLYSGVTVLLAWGFLGEKLRPWQVAGIAVALAAIVLLTR